MPTEANNLSSLFRQYTSSSCFPVPALQTESMLLKYVDMLLLLVIFALLVEFDALLLRTLKFFHSHDLIIPKFLLRPLHVYEWSAQSRSTLIMLLLFRFGFAMHWLYSLWNGFTTFDCEIDMLSRSIKSYTRALYRLTCVTRFSNGYF